MPVPVPVYYKPTAHPVIKNNCSQVEDTAYPRHSVFQHLTNSLPLPPSGPPPAFASREEWINSLPSWRRNKPRRVWEEDSASVESGQQDFSAGLAVAGDATVIKGTHAQASIPPVSTLLSFEGSACTRGAANMYPSIEEDADDEMSSTDGVMGWQGEDMLQLTDEDEDMAAEDESDSGSLEYASDYQSAMYTAVANTDVKHAYSRSYERGAFSPVLEDVSDNEPASSPAGPATPFADYVDRAVADSRLFQYPRPPAAVAHHAQLLYGEEYCGNQCYQCQHYVAEQNVPAPPVAAAPAAAPEPVVTPTASVAYRKLAEPLAEWMTTFVWKVCTTGMSLPPTYAQPS